MHLCMNMHAHLDRVNGLSSLGSQFPPRTQWGTEEELALVNVQGPAHHRHWPLCFQTSRWVWSHWFELFWSPSFILSERKYTKDLHNSFISVSLEPYKEIGQMWRISLRAKWMIRLHTAPTEDLYSVPSTYVGDLHMVDGWRPFSGPTGS